MRVTKVASRNVVSWTHNLPFWLWSIFNSIKWLYYQYSRSFFEFCWMLIFPWIKLSWLSCSVWWLYWIQLEWLYWFCYFSVRGYLSLCEGRTSFCKGLISRKLCRLLLMFSTDFTSFSIFFFLYESPSSSLCTVFDAISSNIDEVLSINPSPNVFVF